MKSLRLQKYRHHHPGTNVHKDLGILLLVASITTLESVSTTRPLRVDDLATAMFQWQLHNVLQQ